MSDERLNPADDPSAGGDDFAPDFVEEDRPEDMSQGDRLERLEKLQAMLTEAQWEVSKRETALEEAIKLERKIREESIPTLMKEVRMKEITLQGGVKLIVEDDFKCGVSKEHKPLAYQWLRDNKLGAIIKRVVGVAFGAGQDDTAASLQKQLSEAGYVVDDDQDVHWQTLRAALKEEREKGHTVPQDLFNIFDYQTTKLKYPRGVTPPPKPRYERKK